MDEPILGKSDGKGRQENLAAAGTGSQVEGLWEENHGRPGEAHFKMGAGA